MLEAKRKMKFEDVRTKFQKLEKEMSEAKVTAKRLRESRIAELYKEMNEIVFENLELNLNNCDISEGNKADLDSYFKGDVSRLLSKIAGDLGILTISLPVSAFKKPYLLTDGSDKNMLFVSSFIQDYDSLNNGHLADSIINVELASKYHFNSSFTGYIFGNSAVETLCVSHNRYLVGFEIVENSAKSKKAKEAVLDFKFYYISNKPSEKAPEHEDPSIKLAKMAEAAKPKQKKPECHGDGIPKDGQFVKIVEVKDPSQIPELIDKLFRNIEL